MRFAIALTIGLVVVTGVLLAEDPSSSPRPIPLTRPEMKRLLEDMKQRKPRIPLPELTEEEKANAGERGTGYEARMRSLYLQGQGSGFGGPGGAGGGRQGGGGGAGNRQPEANMSLDYAFKTELFWIVSRANNCQY